MTTRTPADHAAEIFTPGELTQALVAERLDKMVDVLINRGKYNVALFGSKRHAQWLEDNISGMGGIPMMFLISGYDADLPVGSTYQGIEVVSITDPRLAELDCVLISDDRHENKLFEIASEQLDAGILIWRLYERLPIGDEPLPQAIVESKQVVRSVPQIAGKPRMDSLFAGSAAPVVSYTPSPIEEELDDALEQKLSA